MSHLCSWLGRVAVAGAVWGLASGAWAACTPITAVPFIISASGEYCLTADLTSSQTSGGAIEVEADNVLLDFQGHSLDGTSAGTGTLADGVHSLDRQGITVRNGKVVGFYIGVHLDILSASGNHVIEDMRLEKSRWKAIKLEGSSNVMRRNLVLDTGGAGHHADGVSACENGFGGSVEAYNNVIQNVGIGEPDASPDGMMLYCLNTIAIGNRVINVEDSGISVGGGYCKDNVLVNSFRPYDRGLGNGCTLVGSTNFSFP